jgi:hypothetical protein
VSQTAENIEMAERLMGAAIDGRGPSKVYRYFARRCQQTTEVCNEPGHPGHGCLLVNPLGHGPDHSDHPPSNPLSFEDCEVVIGSGAIVESWHGYLQNAFHLAGQTASATPLSIIMEVFEVAHEHLLPCMHRVKMSPTSGWSGLFATHPVFLPSELVMWAAQCAPDSPAHRFFERAQTTMLHAVNARTIDDLFSGNSVAPGAMKLLMTERKHTASLLHKNT